MITIFKKYILSFLLISPIALSSQIYQIGQDIDGEAGGDQSGYSVTMNAAGDRVAIGANYNDGNGSNAGHVRIYQWSGTSWAQQGQDIDGEAASDYSGYSVTMNNSGDRVAIGAYLNDGNGNSSGHVRIYQWNGVNWTQQGQDIDGEASSDYSGWSVTMNAVGNRVAIGAPGNDGNGFDSGNVRIYQWNGTSWVQEGQNINGEAASDQSGYSITMNAAGDRVAIGAYANDGNGSNAGHVRIYQWNGTNWMQQGQDIDGEAADNYSGRSVTMNASGDRVAIGANVNDGNGSNAGHVRIYQWNGANWTQQGQDIDGEAAGDYSGTSVSMNAAGNRVAIGAIYNDGNGSNAGHVRLYQWNGANWTQQGQDIEGESVNDYSGYAVIMNAPGDRVAIGAYLNDGNGSSAGHVRVYHDPNAIVNVGFEVNDELICLGDTVQFTDTSNTNAVAWQWYFGDGQASNLANPYHAYAQEGNYDVTLIISDSSGALDSAIYYSYVQVIGPNSVNATQQDSVCLSGGAISLDVSAFTLSNIAYQINWSNGSNSSQISGLNQGTYHYTLVVDQCVLQDTFSIGTGPNNNIQLQTYSDNVSCFGYDGSAGVSTINGLNFSHEENFDTGNFQLDGWDNTITSTSWIIHSNSYSGPNSMRSGNISNYGTTSIELNTNFTDSADISFFKSVSSESGYDKLRFYIDGIQQNFWSGYISWSQETYNVSAGTHVFKWSYTKDGSVSSGSDAAWVDDIIISGNDLSGFTYQWNDPQQQTTPNITGLNGGTYQVTVFDSLGCSGIANVTVDPFAPINVVVNTQDITCEGLTDGTATASVSGGDAPYTYQFSAGFSSDSVVNSLASGPFYVDITDNDGCTSMSNFYINDANVPVITLSGTDPSCNSGLDGSISSIINGGNSPFTYLWNDSLQQSTANASNLINGTYTLTITDNLNCSYDSSITISNQFIVNVETYPPSCYGLSNGSIAIDVQNGNSPGYLWSNSSTNDSIYGLGDGAYIFTISDGILCDYVDTAYITQPDSLINSAQISDVSCNINNGAITVNTNGYGNHSNVLEMSNNGYSDFTNISTYLPTYYPDKISFDIMSPDISSNSASYMHSSFLVEDGSSDIVWFIMSMDENTLQPIMGPVVSSSVNGSVPSYFSYDVIPFYYTPGEWYNIEFRNINFPANTYDYYVNNQLVKTGVPFRNYCYNVDRVRINHYSNENVTSYFDNIDFSVNGNNIWGEDFESGLPNWSYGSLYSNNIVNANIISNNVVSFNWSNGDTTQTISNLAAGIYTVSVSSDTNCLNTATYTVSDLGSPTISLTSSNTSCLGASDGIVQIDINGGVSPYSYSYNQGNTATSSIVDAGAENGLGDFISSGTVNFTTTNAFSHSGSSSYYNSYSNNNNNYLTIDTTFDFTNMNEGFLNFWQIAKTRGTGDYCYIEYSTDGGSFWYKISPNVYTGNATTYTGTSPYFDEYSYSDWSSSSSPNNNWWKEENFDLSFLAGQNNVKIRFHLSSNSLYTKYGWLIDDITVAANNSNDTTIYNLSSGVFPLTVTDSNNCSVMDSIVVGYNQYNMNLNFATTNTSCPGVNSGSVQVSVNGGSSPYSYNFSTGSFANGNFINEDAENGLGNFVTSGTNYFVTTTSLSYSGSHAFYNDYNNYNSNYLTYDNDIDLSTATSVSLNFWQIAKTEGGYDGCYIQYSDDGGVNWYNIPSNYYSGSASNYNGSYPSFDEDSYVAWGTSNTTPDNTWWQEEDFDLSFLAGENDVRLRFYLYSGSSSYRHGWLLDDIVLSVIDFQDSTAYNLGEGMINVYVTDSTGCGTIDSVYIGVDSLFTASTQVNNVTCNGDNDGSISIITSGGTTPFTYLWSSGTGSNHTEGFESSVNSNYWSSYTGNISSAGCGVNSGAYAMIFNSSGSRNITSTLQSISPNSSISFYLLYGSASNSCEAVDSGEEVSLEYSLNGTNNWISISTYNLSSYQTGIYEYITETFPASTHGNDIYIRIIQNSHSGSGYDEWSIDDINLNNGISGTSNTNFINNLSPGNYSVSVIDSAGCIIDTIANIIDPPLLTSYGTANSNGNLCYGDNNGIANVNASGGVPPYSFSWSNGGTTSSINSLNAGSYNCAITDSFGCVKNQVVQVTSPSQIIGNVSVNDISCYGENDGSLGLVVTGGIPPYTVNWSNGSSATALNNLSSGNYSATITDDNSCFIQISTTITEPSDLLINMTTVDATIGFNNGSATAYVSGGTPPYYYSWDNGGIYASIYGLGSGIYNLTVRDQNQCLKADSAVINSITSIINDISDTEISISPNPFLDYTKVNIPNNNSLYSISIYNSIGELVRLKNNNSGEIIIRKGDLARGVYTLIVNTENEIIKKQIIVK